MVRAMADVPIACRLSKKRLGHRRVHVILETRVLGQPGSEEFGLCRYVAGPDQYEVVREREYKVLAAEPDQVRGG